MPWPGISSLQGMVIHSCRYRRRDVYTCIWGDSSFHVDQQMAYSSCDLHVGFMSRTFHLPDMLPVFLDWVGDLWLPRNWTLDSFESQPKRLTQTRSSSRLPKVLFATEKAKTSCLSRWTKKPHSRMHTHTTPAMHTRMSVGIASRMMILGSET